MRHYNFVEGLLVGMTLISGAVMRAAAQEPLSAAISYQGELQVAGTPSAGLHDLRFRLYDALNGGVQVGAMLCSDNVSVTEGRFTVPLDFGLVYTGQERYLEIEVRADSGLDCSNAADFTSLVPRQRLLSAPYANFATTANSAATAVNAANASQLSGQAASFYQNATNISSGTLPGGRLGGTYSGLLNLSHTGNTILGIFTGSGAGLTSLNANSITSGVLGTAHLPTGGAWGLTSPLNVDGGTLYIDSTTDRIGIGTTTPSSLARLHAVGNIEGVRGESSSTGGSGVYGLASATSGFSDGVTGQSNSISGTGVYGLASATSGSALGVFGQSNSNVGTGVFGFAGASAGVNFGVRGQSGSTDGQGVHGIATASTGTTYGVWGESVSTSGKGMYGLARASSGFTDGVRGQSHSTSGRGVLGIAIASTGTTYGVYGSSSSPSGRGVSGSADASSGVNYGVEGVSTASASGWGVYAVGRMGASGTKSFRIDHPEDPENKYLLHYAAESPEVINFYRGTIVLDGRGEAEVVLPAYFARINRDPSYQLTAVGVPMPMLHIAAKIDPGALSVGEKAAPGDAVPECRFRIAGGAPGAEVSWEVKAVRNDLWVRAYGAPVEVEKQGLEAGLYQHPALYNQREKRDMNSRPASEVPARAVPTEPARVPGESDEPLSASNG